MVRTNNRRGPFERTLQHFEYDYMLDDAIRRIEETSIEHHGGGWMYAIKVVVAPGRGGHLPRVYCGYNVVVVSEDAEWCGGRRGPPRTGRVRGGTAW